MPSANEIPWGTSDPSAVEQLENHDGSSDASFPSLRGVGHPPPEQNS